MVENYVYGFKTVASSSSNVERSLPQESGTNQNALMNPPFCGDKFFTEKR
jgi:hypothetical protein